MTVGKQSPSSAARFVPGFVYQAREVMSLPVLNPGLLSSCNIIKKNYNCLIQIVASHITNNSGVPATASNKESVYDEIPRKLAQPDINE